MKSCFLRASSSRFSVTSFKKKMRFFLRGGCSEEPGTSQVCCCSSSFPVAMLESAAFWNVAPNFDAAVGT